MKKTSSPRLIGSGIGRAQFLPESWETGLPASGFARWQSQQPKAPKELTKTDAKSKFLAEFESAWVAAEGLRPYFLPPAVRRIAGSSRT